MAIAALDATFAFKAEGRRRQKGSYIRKARVFQETSRQTSTYKAPQRCTVSHLEMETKEHGSSQTSIVRAATGQGVRVREPPSAVGYVRSMHSESRAFSAESGQCRPVGEPSCVPPRQQPQWPGAWRLAPSDLTS